MNKNIFGGTVVFIIERLRGKEKRLKNLEKQVNILIRKFEENNDSIQFLESQLHSLPNHLQRQYAPLRCEIDSIYKILQNLNIFKADPDIK